MDPLRPDEVARGAETEPEPGLSAAEAARRLDRYGANALVEPRGRSRLTILLAQFKSLIVALLLAAAAVAVALGDPIEAAAILVVIVLNALIGFFTEWKAQQTLAALRRQTSPTAQVIRDGQEHEISAVEVRSTRNWLAARCAFWLLATASCLRATTRRTLPGT